MQRFIVERNLTKQQSQRVGSAETIINQSQQLATSRNRIEWVTTITTAVKVYAIYEAPSAEYLRQIAYHHNFTIHRLLQINQQL